MPLAPKDALGNQTGASATLAGPPGAAAGCRATRSRDVWLDAYGVGAGGRGAPIVGDVGAAFVGVDRGALRGSALEAGGIEH